MRKSSVCGGFFTVALIVIFLLMGACSPTEETEAPFRPIADVKQLMHGVIDPAADALWASVGTILTVEGVEEIFPKTDEEWAAVRNSALIITESGNLLMMGNRVQDGETWIEMSQAMIEAGQVALKAIDAKDVAAVFTAGGVVYETCRNCHSLYWLEDNPDIIRGGPGG